jgi:hypothetical protein
MGLSAIVKEIKAHERRGRLIDEEIQKSDRLLEGKILSESTTITERDLYQFINFNPEEYLIANYRFKDFERGDEIRLTFEIEGTQFFLNINSQRMGLRIGYTPTIASHAMDTDLEIIGGDMRRSVYEKYAGQLLEKQTAMKQREKDDLPF